MRWISCGEYEDVEVFDWVLETGVGSSAEEALRAVGLGVKGFGTFEGGGLLAFWSVPGDERIWPHRAVPLKPVKIFLSPGASFGRCLAALTSVNSS